MCSSVTPNSYPTPLTELASSKHENPWLNLKYFLDKIFQSTYFSGSSRCSNLWQVFSKPQYMESLICWKGQEERPGNLEIGWLGKAFRFLFCFMLSNTLTCSKLLITFELSSPSSPFIFWLNFYLSVSSLFMVISWFSVIFIIFIPCLNYPSVCNYPITECPIFVLSDT